jgi:hypothetical protein
VDPLDDEDVALAVEASVVRVGHSWGFMRALKPASACLRQSTTAPFLLLLLLLLLFLLVLCEQDSTAKEKE